MLALIQGVATRSTNPYIPIKVRIFWDVRHCGMIIGVIKIDGIFQLAKGIFAGNLSVHMFDDQAVLRPPVSLHKIAAAPLRPLYQR